MSDPYASTESGPLEFDEAPKQASKGLLILLGLVAGVALLGGAWLLFFSGGDDDLDAGPPVLPRPAASASVTPTAPQTVPATFNADLGRDPFAPLYPPKPSASAAPTSEAPVTPVVPVVPVVPNGPVDTAVPSVPATQPPANKPVTIRLNSVNGSFTEAKVRVNGEVYTVRKGQPFADGTFVLVQFVDDAGEKYATFKRGDERFDLYVGETRTFR